MARRKTPAWIRFITKRQIVPNGCHKWTAFRNPNGYGTFKHGNDQYAHRVAYRLFAGDIPDGMTIDHYCYPQDGCIGPACVNPEHLRVATQRENILRSSGISAKAAVATHCPSGHPYAGDNLYLNSMGHRFCRECNRQRGRVNYYKQKVSA